VFTVNKPIDSLESFLNNIMKSVVEIGSKGARERH